MTAPPQPSDPPFLFVTLLAARKAGDAMLEGLARRWLADIGISVEFEKPKAEAEAADASR